MTITKEKNIITITIEGNKAYKIDINSGTIYGVSGKALKALPSLLGRELKRIRRTTTDVQALWVFADDSWWTYKDLYDNGIRATWLEHMQMLDKFQAINYPMTNCRNTLYVSKKDFDKFFSKFAKAYMADNSLIFEDYVEEAKKNCFLTDLKIDENMPYMTEGVVRLLKNWYDTEEFTNKQFKHIVRYLTFGQLYNCTLGQNFFGSPTILRQFKEYFKNCDFLNLDYTKDDFYKHYGYVAKIADERKNEILNAEIALQQNKRKNALTFETDLYTIVIPMTVEEFIAEGENNRNCVGSYGSYVARGSKNVVFVRSKADVNASLVTVDVDSKGDIVQYYTFGNRSVYYGENPALYEFRVAYQKHIKENWV